MKPLAPVAGLPLIERAIRTVTAAGATEVVVAVGYRGAEVEAFLVELSARLGVPIRCVRNERFDEGNGLSLLAAEPVLGPEPFLLVMADHVLDEALVRRLARSPVPLDGAVLAVDHDTGPRPEIDLDDVTRVATAGGRVRQVAKHLPVFDGYDTGAFLCSTGVFAAMLEAVADGDTALSAGMQRLADTGRLAACDVTGCRWIDVDTPADRRTASRSLLRRGGKALDGAVAARFNRLLSQRLATPALLAVVPTVTANQVTLVAAAVAFAAAGMVLAGWVLPAAVLVQVASVLDGSDGEIARVAHRGSAYGAFLDPVLDRVVDGALFGAVVIFLGAAYDGHAAVLAIALLATVGHLLVSYTSARAELDLGHRYHGPLLASGRGRDLRLFLLVAALVASAWAVEPLLATVAGIAALCWWIVLVRLWRSWVLATHPWADVDLVLVDFDGTIADSMPALTALAVDAITTELALDEALARARYLASTGADFSSQMAEIQPVETPERRRVIEKFEAGKAAVMAATDPFPDVAPFLDELATAGVPVGVCSSTRREIVQGWLERHGLASRFARIDGWAPGHPKDVQLAEALIHFQVDPDRCLFVGDSRRDARIAERAGVCFRGVLRPETTNLPGGGLPYEASLVDIGTTVRRVRNLDITVEATSAPFEVARVVRPHQAGEAVVDGDRRQGAVGHLDAAVAGGAGPRHPGNGSPHDRIVREEDNRSLA